MKNKILPIFLIVCLIAIIIPGVISAYENKDAFEFGDATYQLFDDGTAKLTSIKGSNSGEIPIYNNFLYNEEEYTVTGIASNAFSNITNKCDLHLYVDKAPKLEANISFDMINNIYIPLDAQGYTSEAGWPTEKLKNYKIEEQPQDLVVTAGDVKDTDTLYTRASIAISAGSIQYKWYSCDKDGNITDDRVLGYYADFQIPTDITYDNENNAAKDYYFICVVGTEGEILEPSRVAKVTVNPGIYKVFFNSGIFAEWTIESTKGSVVVPVNNERKIAKADIPSSDLLKTYGKGLTFVGWTIDEENVNVVDLSTIKFDKNTTLYPIWQYKVTFDANGGSFEDGKDTVIFNTTNYDYELYAKIYSMEQPTREGYGFAGFFTEKTGGTSLEYLMSEDGVSEEITFYAQWKELETEGIAVAPDVAPDFSSSDNNSSQELDSDIESSNDTKNPKTGDNIIFFAGLLVVSVAGIFVTTKFRRKA